MVAVYAANQAPDAALASELGSLLLAHTRIRDPRWRLDAIVRRVPALVRFGVSLDATRAAIRELGARASCPAPLRDLLVELTGTHFDASFVRALWLPDWKTCARAAVDAAVRVSAFEAVERVVETAAAGPRGRHLLPRIERRRTLVDLMALVDDGRAGEAERVARELRPHEQVFATAHLARLDLRAGKPVRRVRGGHRAGAELLLVREVIALGDIERARYMAERIERTLIRQCAYLDLARALSRRGRIVDALRLLHGVTRAELAGECHWLREEIRLMVRRDREHGMRLDAMPEWQLPAWLRPRGSITIWERRWRHFAALFARLGLRGDASGIRLFGGYAKMVTATALFELLPLVGVDIDDALTALRGTDVVDRLLAERIAIRAIELAATTRALPDAMRLGLAGLATCDNSDGRTLERAFFDEGIALSASAARRRRVLIGVAHSCLRSAPSQPLDVVRVRLRMLVHLGGSLAADAIAKPMAQLPIDPAIWLVALEALCSLDPSRAGAVVVERIAELRRAGIDPALALDHVVVAGGITADRAAAFVGTSRMLDAALGEQAHRWLADFTRRWKTRTGAGLDETCLAWLRTCDLQRDPQSLLDELDSHTSGLLAADSCEIAERLATDANLLRATLLDTPRIDRRMRPWTLERWKSLLAKATTRAHSVDLALVRRVARLLQKPKAAHALAGGDLASLGVLAVTDVGIGDERFRIRVLDKRRDLLTYLRFADTPARSCYRSDSWMYRSEPFPTELEVIAAWRDPLTICIHIERADQVCGFAFGSFAEIEGRAALLFNSLHVRPNTPSVREPLLRAIERSVCVPLGVRWFGIANAHNGEGHLPDDYVFDYRAGIRLRALSSKGELVTNVDDDISITVNSTCDFDLYWRDLA